MRRFAPLPPSLILAALAAAVLVAVAAPPAAAGYQFPICTAPGGQYYPAISGNIVVWLDTRNDPGDYTNPDIYGYDLSTGQEFPICTAPGEQTFPAISGNIVVWADRRNYATSGSEIRGYNLSTAEEFVIATSYWGEADQAAISGNIVVWVDRYFIWDGDIRAKDLSTGQELYLGGGRFPSVSGSIVVWAAPSYNYSIVGYDLSTGEQLSISSPVYGYKGGPRIAGNLVVWEDWRNMYSTDFDIYGYDLSSRREFAICTDPSRQEKPAITGTLVVWADSRREGWKIYAKNLSIGSEFALCSIRGWSSPSLESGLAVSDRVVAWQDDRNGDLDILGYRLDVGGPPGTTPGGPMFPPNPPEGTVRHYLTGQLHAHWMADANPLTFPPQPLFPHMNPTILELMYQSLGYEFIAPTEHHPDPKWGTLFYPSSGTDRLGRDKAAGLFDDPELAIIHLGDSLEDTAGDSHILAAGFDHTASTFDLGAVGQTPLDDRDDELFRRERLDNIRFGGGGLAFVAHPDVRQYLWSDQTLTRLHGKYDGIEVFNSANRSNAVDTWTKLLKAGLAVRGVAGDDFTPGYAWALNRACVTAVIDRPEGTGPTKTDVANALRWRRGGGLSDSGRFYVSYAPVTTGALGGASTAPRIEGWWYDAEAARARIQFSSVWGIKDVRFFTDPNADSGREVSFTPVGGGWEASYSCTSDDKWVRAQVKDVLNAVSLTQPIWLDRREGVVGQWLSAGAGLRAAQTASESLVVELANAHLDLPSAQPEAQAWGALVAQEDRPEVAPPLGYFGYCYEFQTNAPVPEGATLTISYDAADIQLCAEEALAIYRYEPLTGEWMPAVSVVDSVNHRVWAEISQLGMYALSGDLPEDITPPTVEILVSPGVVLSGEMEISAEITDDNGVASARFMLDDMDLGSDTTGRDGWSALVDFSVIAQGNYMLRVSATDASGNEAEASVPVVVASAVPAPVITISSPAPEATLPTEFLATGTWGAVKPLAGGILWLDDLPLGVLIPQGNGYDWVAEVTLPFIPGGAHTLRVAGSDEDENEASAEITVYTAGVADHFAVQVIPAPPEPQGGDLSAPLPFVVRVEARDSEDALVAGYDGTADLASSIGAATPAAITFTDGVWEGPVTIAGDTPAPCYLTVTDHADPAISGQSLALDLRCKGDPTGDGAVNIFDVLRTVNIALGNTIPQPPRYAFQFWAGDVNRDSVVNVFDVIQVVNKSLGRVAAASGLMAAARKAAGPVEVTVAPARGGAWAIRVRNAGGLAGAQLEIACKQGEVAAGELAAGWQVQAKWVNGRLRVIAYSPTATGLTASEGTLLLLTNTRGRPQAAHRPQVVGVMFADAAGNTLAAK